MKHHILQETIDWYNDHAEDYAKFSYTGVQQDVIDKFLSLLPKEPVILDAGCGPGRDSAIFAKRGAKVTGLDLSTELIKIARKKYPKVAFIEGNFLALPFPDVVFDGIWAHAALVHLETITDVKQSLSEFYRVLKNKGMLNVYVKEKSSSEEIAIVPDSSNKDRYFRYFSMDEMINYLEEIGFTINQATERKSVRRKGLIWLSIFAKK